MPPRMHNEPVDHEKNSVPASSGPIPDDLLSDKGYEAEQEPPEQDAGYVTEDLSLDEGNETEEEPDDGPTEFSDYLDELSEEEMEYELQNKRIESSTLYQILFGDIEQRNGLRMVFHKLAGYFDGQVAESYRRAAEADENSEEFRQAVFLFAQQRYECLEKLFIRLGPQARAKSLKLYRKNIIETARLLQSVNYIPDAKLLLANLYSDYIPDRSRKAGDLEKKEAIIGLYESYIQEQTTPDTVELARAHLNIFYELYLKENFAEALIHLEKVASLMRNTDAKYYKLRRTMERVSGNIQNSYPLNSQDPFYYHYNKHLLKFLDEVCGRAWAKAPFENRQKPVLFENMFGLQQISFGFIPVLRLLGRDVVNLKSLHGALNYGVCFAMAIIWLNAARVSDNITQKAMSKEHDADDLEKLYHIFDLINHTDFTSMYLKLHSKQELTTEEQNIIAKVEEFVQHVFFHQYPLVVEEGKVGRDAVMEWPETYFGTGFQNDKLFLESFFETTDDVRVTNCALVEIDDFAQAPFNNFIAGISDLHAVAIKRIDDKFIMYDPSGFITPENPTILNADQVKEKLEFIMNELKRSWDDRKPKIEIMGLEFEKLKQRAAHRPS